MGLENISMVLCRELEKLLCCTVRSLTHTHKHTNTNLINSNVSTVERSRGVDLIKDCKRNGISAQLFHVWRSLWKAETSLQPGKGFRYVRLRFCGYHSYSEGMSLSLWNRELTVSIKRGHGEIHSSISFVTIFQLLKGLNGLYVHAFHCKKTHFKEIMFKWRTREHSVVLGSMLTENTVHIAASKPSSLIRWSVHMWKRSQHAKVYKQCVQSFMYQWSFVLDHLSTI